MIPNLFEAYAMTNKDIANTTLTLAHVTKINPGSFANAYAGAAGPTAGYTSEGPAHTTEHQGTFTNMGTWATGDATKGVSTLGLVYKGDNFKLQAWDYYAHGILNAIYLQADMSMKVSDSFKSFAAVQYINQSDIGSSFVGKVDSDFVGAKVGAKTGGLTAYVAYSQQSKADTYVRGLESSTVTMWGGVPAFTQGMVTRHMFMAGTKASKVAATYNFKEQGLNLSATAYYASFDMDANSGYGAANTVKEPGFDIKYKPASVKNLQLRLRGNFVNDFKTDRDWDEYRLIVTYKF